jgi:predicted SprT family Zn-dependent metalloprotease
MPAPGFVAAHLLPRPPAAAAAARAALPCCAAAPPRSPQSPRNSPGPVSQRESPSQRSSPGRRARYAGVLASPRAVDLDADVDVGALERQLAGVRVLDDGAGGEVLEILSDGEEDGVRSREAELELELVEVVDADENDGEVVVVEGFGGDGERARAPTPTRRRASGLSGAADESVDAQGRGEALPLRRLAGVLADLSAVAEARPVRRRAAPAGPPACSLRGADTWVRASWAAVVVADAAAGRRARAWTFARAREAAGEALLQYFDVCVLGGRLKGRVEVVWSRRLLKTAGVTVMCRDAAGVRRARVELSVKVVDDLERLYGTLAHELCHAVAWVVDEVSRPPHGREFKAWAAVFRDWDPGLGITTCHEYKIQCRFVYTCQRCANVYGRHSKSIDVAIKVCGKCRGQLVLHVKKPAELRAELSARTALA